MFRNVTLPLIRVLFHHIVQNATKFDVSNGVASFRAARNFWIELNNCAVVAKMVFNVAPRLIEYPAIEVPKELLEVNIAPFSVEDALFFPRV